MCRPQKERLQVQSRGEDRCACVIRRRKEGWMDVCVLAPVHFSIACAAAIPK